MTEFRVVKHNGALASNQVALFRSLRDVCNRFESIELPFYLEGDAIGGDATTAFLACDGTGLIGFAHLPDDPKPEACLAVHPDCRRRGLGSTLVESMRAELRRRGPAEGLLIADRSSASGTAFLKAIAAPYQSSEYRLELNRSQIDLTRPAAGELTMRVAKIEDADLLTRILTAAFANDPDDSRDLIERGLQETKRRFYVAFFEAEPVGMLRAGEIGGAGDVTAFGVLPERQGNGFGRWMLLNAIETLTGQGLDRIGLEVATENAGALGLYESCGFRVISEYGFYTLTV